MRLLEFIEDGYDRLASGLSDLRYWFRDRPLALVVVGVVVLAGFVGTGVVLIGGSSPTHPVTSAGPATRVTFPDSKPLPASCRLSIAAGTAPTQAVSAFRALDRSCPVSRGVSEAEATLAQYLTMPTSGGRPDQMACQNDIAAAQSLITGPSTPESTVLSVLARMAASCPLNDPVGTELVDRWLGPVTG